MEFLEKNYCQISISLLSECQGCIALLVACSLLVKVVQVTSPLLSLIGFLFTLTTYLVSVMGNSGCFILKMQIYLPFVGRQVGLGLEDEVGHFLKYFLALFL